MNHVMKNLALGLVLIFGALQLSAQEEIATKWQLRLRGISVIPSESAIIEAIGGDVDISTALVPELDFTFFFSENLAAELILATTNHDVGAIETAAGDIDLGDVWLLPPTLTLQYHMSGSVFRPYLGAGLNLTLFYGADEGPVADEVSYDTSVGFAFQLGFDYDLSDKWFINFDVKKVLLNTTATVDATTALAARVDAEVEIDPLILGVGIGMKF